MQIDDQTPKNDAPAGPHPHLARRAGCLAALAFAPFLYCSLGATIWLALLGYNGAAFATPLGFPVAYVVGFVVLVRWLGRRQRRYLALIEPR